MDDFELEQLTEALRQDDNKLGSRVSEWIKTTAPKLVVNGVKFGAEVAKPILTAWLTQYLGLPPTK